MSSASKIWNKSVCMRKIFSQTGQVFQIHRPARRGCYRARLRGHDVISVLCAVKRHQKRSQDLPGVQYFKFDAERK